MNTIHTTRSYNGFLTAVSQILRCRFFILWHFHNFINTFWINDYELNFVILAFFSTTFNCPIETFKWAVPNFIKIEPNQRLYHWPICNCTAKKLQGSTKRTWKLLKKHASPLSSFQLLVCLKRQMSIFKMDYNTLHSLTHPKICSLMLCNNAKF